jgi:hypothetical protein
MCIRRSSIVFIITCERPITKEAQHPIHIVDGGKVPNNENSITSENERSNQVAKDRTLLDFHEDDAKSEVEESSQEVEAPIKVYQWWKVLDGVAPTSNRKFQ